MTTTDLTKVNLRPKSLLMLTIAFTAVLVIYGVATVLAPKVSGLFKKMTASTAETVEEAF